ncbi:glycosyltransferase family 2 protein [Candidatus Gracilibacteria bacterium]|nr:glycosyltransferase family 2 protein [Candidatus Gracilibacteria bacterium]
MINKFSVIIPSYNEGEWLKKTVLGVLENTDYPDFEIIVVADGCTDDSLDFLQKGIPNVLLVELEESVGAAKARNMGAKVATGDALVFIDSHMVPSQTDWLQELTVQLEDKKIGAATLKIPYLEEPDRVAFIYTLGDFALEPTWISPLNKAKIHNVPVIPGACFAMRKELFVSTGGFDEGLHKWGREDLEYSLRLWRLGYDLSMSTKSGIAHSWERKRTFEISWDEVDYNILRISLTLLSDSWQKKVKDCLQKVRSANVIKFYRELENDQKFLSRKRDLEQKFKRSFAEWEKTFSAMLPVLRKK